MFTASGVDACAMNRNITTLTLSPSVETAMMPASDVLKATALSTAKRTKASATLPSSAVLRPLTSGLQRVFG